MDKKRTFLIFLLAHFFENVKHMISMRRIAISNQGHSQSLELIENHAHFQIGDFLSLNDQINFHKEANLNEKPLRLHANANFLWKLPMAINIGPRL